MNTKISGGQRVQVYSCAYAMKRGETVCTVSIRQPRDVVEGAIVRHLLDDVLTPQTIERITARVVELAQQDRADEPVPVQQLEEDLAKLRTEQKRCARLLATLEDAGELEAEYSARTAKIRSLEGAIAAEKAAPVAGHMALETLAGEIGATFERLRQGLVGAPDELRQALRSLFERLSFEPEGNNWAVSGRPRLELPAGRLAFVTPPGIEPGIAP